MRSNNLKLKSGFFFLNNLRNIKSGKFGMKGTRNSVKAGRIIDKAKNISFRLEDFMNGIENA